MENTQHHSSELGYSPDAATQRKRELLEVLRQTAPEIISDNQVDVERLKELLGEERVAPPEHYELSWAGKAEARRDIQKKTSSTLRPDPNNPESAQHMLIEGENLETLRVLQKSYYAKVKMIYIDPPYNTGNDSFVYPDNYAETLDEYQQKTGEKNDDGDLNRQSLWKANSKESGHYHSAWLSMMYPRLYLARNLLRDDGVIFISIDDNEAANLKLICDEVFGADSFVGSMSWLKKRKGSYLSKSLVSMTEWVLVYGKSSDVNLFGGKADGSESQPLIKKTNSTGLLNFPGGVVKAKIEDGVYESGLYGKGASSVELIDSVLVRDGFFVGDFSLKGPFVWGQGYLNNQIEGGAKLFINTLNFQIRAFKAPSDSSYKGLSTFVDGVGFSATNEDGYEELGDILGVEGAMSYPKPVNYIKHLISAATYWDKDSIVLDFFAGSGTTAHAVMELNAEDDGSRQSISVQIPEVLEEKTEAYKAGYRTIADITRARIEKAIAKLKDEQPEKTEGLACAHFTLAPSNFKVWDGQLTSEEAIRQQLDVFQQTEKATDSQLDMLTELLLKNGQGALGVHAVSKPRTLACGVTVHRVLREDDRYLWLCFDPYVEALKEDIIKAHPAQVIMLNSSHTGDKADEGLSNLQNELAGHDIQLLII